MKKKWWFCFFCIVLGYPWISSGQSQALKFSNRIQQSNLSPHMDGIHAHGAGWGDIDGDGWLDLFVGVFSDNEKTSLLFRNEKGQFKFDDQPVFRVPTRATGVVFVDLDNDGDQDLYVGSMSKKTDVEIRQAARGDSLNNSKVPAKSYPEGAVGNRLYQNDGYGNFTDISKNNGACPDSIGGRSVSVFDYDGDGLLDILAGEDPMTGYNGSRTKSSRLFKNLGSLKFKDVSFEAGVPDNVPAYGTAVCDVNNDSWPDFFLASNDGGNRLFINDKKGKFYEIEKLNKLFQWDGSGGSNMVCGVAFGDVNRDGLMDVVLGSHFQYPWVNPQPVRLFLNKTDKTGEINFEEVTFQAGLSPIHIKTPHVEIQDFDNDGWPDILVSGVKFYEHGIYPLISRNLGVSQAGIPQFINEANSMNDFPTIQEMNYIQSHKTDSIFLKIQNDKRITYFAPGPTADYDNDGWLDIMLASWWSEFSSLLLHNETFNGNKWLKIKIKSLPGLSAMGIGTRINVYKAGQLGKKGGILGSKEISAGYGYASGPSSIAHFGLGSTSRVDIELILPYDKGKIVKKGIKANQLWIVK